jgi:hypothetical protein
MFAYRHIHKHTCSSLEVKTCNEIEHVSIEGGIEVLLMLDYRGDEFDTDRCVVVI